MAIPRPDSRDATELRGQEHGGDANAVVLTPEAEGAVRLPDSAFVTDSQFVRIGSDLSVELPTGESIVIEGYFDNDVPPDLTSPDGSQLLSPSLVQSFLQPLAPAQYAQMGTAPAASPIGQVDELSGEAFAVRADGSRVQLAKGDAVYQGDVVETGGDGSAIRMVFVDKTMFALGSDAKLALDEMVFNPESLSGSVQFSMLKGVFIFSSGQIAKTDNTDMTVVTPVATIGIRGTEVAGRVDDQGGSQFTIIDGAIEVITQAGSVTLDSQGETTLVAGMSTPPSDPVVLSAAELGQAYSELAGIAPKFLNFGPQPPQGPDFGTPPDGRDRSEADDGDIEATGDTLLASTLPAEGLTIPGVTTGLQGTETEPIEIVTPVPGLDLASNLTFEGTGESSEDDGWDGVQATSGPLLALGPLSSGGSGGTQAGEDADVSTVSFQTGTDGFAAAGDGALDAGSNDATLDFGSDTSPFRGGSSGTDPIGSNPYVSEPFGAAIPDAGNAGSDDGTSAPGGDSGVSGSEPDGDPTSVNAPPSATTEPETVAASAGGSDLTEDPTSGGDEPDPGGGTPPDATDDDGPVPIDAAKIADIWPVVFDLATGDGDDRVVLDGVVLDTVQLTFNGGDDVDTLELTGPGGGFDLSSGTVQIIDVARIDLSGPDNFDLKIRPSDVPDVPKAVADVNDLEVLVVDGDAGDTVNLVGAIGPGRAWEEDVDAEIEGYEGYTIYEHSSGAQVVADADITVV